jgi:DNA-binding NarL/FixJ family response regulator
MRVLIVDDHPLYREGLNALLACLDPSIETLHAASVEQAISIGQLQEIDLVLLDLQMPGTDKLEALEQVKPAFEGTAVVVISANEDVDLIRGAIDLGASGYIPKRTDPAITIKALQTVLESGIYLPAELLDNGHTDDADNHALTLFTTMNGGVSSVHDALSPRQLAVLQRVLQGKANKIIAREMNIAEGTVKAHLSVVFKTIGVSTRAQAMYSAQKLGLLGLPWPVGNEGEAAN